MPALYEYSLSQIALALQNKECSASEVLGSCLERIRSTEPQLNACISVLEEEAKKQAAALDAAGPCPEQPLWGVPLGLKDSIALKDSPLTCASKMLAGFTPPYDATATARLKEAGAIIAVKNNLDEFSIGSTGESSFFGPTANPWSQEHSPGGSSSGSAASVAAGQVFAALGGDTGGSVRLPAGMCGCVGLKPSYGRVSRYGAVAYASSLDQLGPLARSVEDCARVFQAICGLDPRDSTSVQQETEGFIAAAQAGGTQEPAAVFKGCRIGVPKELWESGLSAEVDEVCRAALQLLEDCGAQLVPISLPHQQYAFAIYKILSNAEGSTNLARFDGVRFGHRAEQYDDLVELYTRSRTEGLGQEVKNRIVFGTFALSADNYEKYYVKAAQARRLIMQELEVALSGCVALVSPLALHTACKIGRCSEGSRDAFRQDILLVGANLAGLPALALPAGLGKESKLPIGIQFMGNRFAESSLFKLGAAFEQLCPPLGIPAGL